MKPWAAAAWAAIAWAWAAAGALGPMDTLVVVNQNDRASRALGDYYMEKHGIPASHRCPVAIPAKIQELSPDAFERDVRVPIDAFLDRSGLRGQINAVVFCWEGPTRVGFNGLPAAFYYGFKARKPDGGQCQIADDSGNRYFLAERPYGAAAGWSPLKAPLAFVLTGRTAADAKSAVDGAVASRGTRPEGAPFVLASSGDAARNVRARFHAGVGSRFAQAGMGDWVETRAHAPAEMERAPMACSLGQGDLPGVWATNGFRMAPGSIGEHLTSCGGQLPHPCYNQSSVWDWLSKGASAAYGTVSEPCNFTAKFPHPVYAYYYARGWSAGEALWMAVENPYQGLFAGDPLAAPFAAEPRVEIRSPRDGERVGTACRLELAVSAHPQGTPPVYLDLYIDGRHYTPMARPLAAAGNEVEVTVGEGVYRYTVQREEDLYGTAEGVAWAIRNGSGGKVQARARGDSVTVTLAGDEPVRVGARATAGLAAAVRMGAKACSPNGRTVPDGAGRQGTEIRLWMGAVDSYPLSYPLDLAFLDPGAHVLTVVARDGTAVQAQGQASVTVVVEGQ